MSDGIKGWWQENFDDTTRGAAITGAGLAGVLGVLGGAWEAFQADEISIWKLLGTVVDTAISAVVLGALFMGGAALLNNSESFRNSGVGKWLAKVGQGDFEGAGEDVTAAIESGVETVQGWVTSTQTKLTQWLDKNDYQLKDFGIVVGKNTDYTKLKAKLKEIGVDIKDGVTNADLDKLVTNITGHAEAAIAAVTGRVDEIVQFAKDNDITLQGFKTLADVTGDGQIDEKDVGAISEYLAGKGIELGTQTYSTVEDLYNKVIAPNLDEIKGIELQ